MALNEMIAQGAQFKMPDPLEQYGRIAQIQQAQNQNALAQYQISSAQRADETNTNFLRELRAAGDDPAKQRQALLNAGKVEDVSKFDLSALTRQKTQGDIQKLNRDDFTERLQDISSNSSKENVLAHLQDIKASASYSPEFKALATIKLTDLAFMSDEDRAKATKFSGVTGAQKLTANRPIASGGAVFDVNGKLIGQGPEPGFTLNPGQTRYPRGYVGTNVVAAPAAAPAAKAEPPSVLEYQFAKTVDGGSFVGTYQDFVKAKADALRAPAAVAAPPAQPASVLEYEYAKTVSGGSFVGTYQDFVKVKAEANRAPAAVAAPQAQPASVLEYNFAKTSDGGSFVGTYQDFVKAKAEANRAPSPIAAPQAQPASVLEYNFAKTTDGGGFVGTYQDFVQSKAEANRAPAPIAAAPTKVTEYEYAKTSAGGSYKGTYQQFLNIGKSGSGEGGGGAGGAAGTGTIKVVDPNNPTKTIFVTKERAVREGLTPAEAIEGLTPQMRQKLEASYPQATSSLRGHQNKTALFIKDVKALRDSPGLDSVTGFAAGRAPGLTDAGRATVALYDKVVAKGGFQSLQDMRDMSKTGGALGNVSDRENQQLKASFAAIDRKQNANDVRTALDDLIKELEGGLGRLQDAYDLTYEYKRGTAAPAANQYVEIKILPDGRKLGKKADGTVEEIK